MDSVVPITAVAIAKIMAINVIILMAVVKRAVRLDGKVPCAIKVL